MLDSRIGIVPAAFSIRYAWRRALLDQMNGVIFVPIPKVASTSMEYFLISKQNLAAGDLRFAKIKQAQRDIRLLRFAKNPVEAIKLYRKYKVICFLRNPVERFISVNNMINSRQDFRAQIERKIGKALHGENHIDALVEYVNQTTIPDWHLLPQYWFVNKIRIDVNIRLGVDDIYQKLSDAGLRGWIQGFPSDALNRSIKSNILLKDSQLREIRKIYRKDLKLFNKYRKQF